MIQDEYKIRRAYPGDSSRKYGEVEIISDNLLYVELQDTHSGCQCNNLENEYLIHQKCREISKLIKEIDQLNRKA